MKPTLSHTLVLERVFVVTAHNLQYEYCVKAALCSFYALKLWFQTHFYFSLNCNGESGTIRPDVRLYTFGCLPAALLREYASLSSTHQHQHLLPGYKNLVSSLVCVHNGRNTKETKEDTEQGNTQPCSCKRLPGSQPKLCSPVPVQQGVPFPPLQVNKKSINDFETLNLRKKD